MNGNAGMQIQGRLSREVTTVFRGSSRMKSGSVSAFSAMTFWRSQALSRIMSAAFSAIMIVSALVLPPTMVGMIDASTTRNAPTKEAHE